MYAEKHLLVVKKKYRQAQDYGHLHRKTNKH